MAGSSPDRLLAGGGWREGGTTLEWWDQRLGRPHWFLRGLSGVQGAGEPNPGGPRHVIESMVTIREMEEVGMAPEKIERMMHQRLGRLVMRLARQMEKSDGHK